MRWDGRRWDLDDIAEPCVVEAVRLFMDRTERDYRVEATFAHSRLERLIEELTSRLSEDQKMEKKKPKPMDQLFKEFGTAREMADFLELSSDLMYARQQADMWLNLLSAGKISSITKLCRGMEGVITRSTEFDNHPDLLNCHNGVVDLRTGELREPDPALMMTHLAGGDYDPKAASAAWTKALESVEPNCTEWFQMRVGQSATGHTPEDDMLIVAEGGGENGKSAVMSAIMRAMGSYGRLISHRVLLGTPSDHPTELMDLRGLRFALLEETPEEGRLDTHRLKATIGNDTITARQMRRDDVTFHTSHSLWINTNFLPQIDTTDHGTWRRLKAMPWPFRFRKPGEPIVEKTDRPGDLGLKSKLRFDEDVPAAVLAWIVAGAVRWYSAGKAATTDPEPVKRATERWRSNADIAFRFASERLVTDSGSFITAETMRAEFLGLLEAEGKRAWSNATVNTRLAASMLAAGVVPDKDPTGMCRLTEAMTESTPDQRASAAQRTQLDRAKPHRVWRGVRFKTKDEMRGSHLRVVRPTAVNDDIDQFIE